MHRLADLLDPALRKMGVRGPVREAQLGEALSQVVGPALAPHCSAIKLERKALVIGVTNPALSHQLQMESPRIIEGLNQIIGTTGVERLRFTAR
jgi:hypothetical protein